MAKEQLKEQLKEAFEAGRDYQYNVCPFSGKPTSKEALSFTKWYNKKSAKAKNI